MLKLPDNTLPPEPSRLRRFSQILLAKMNNAPKEELKPAAVSEAKKKEGYLVNAPVLKILAAGRTEHIVTLLTHPTMPLYEFRRLLMNTPGLTGKLFFFVTQALEDVDVRSEKTGSVGDVLANSVYIREAPSSGNSINATVAIMLITSTGPADVQRLFCICGLLADFECSQCETQGYCSQKCQETHWPEHYLRCLAIQQANDLRVLSGQESAGNSQTASATSYGRIAPAARTSISGRPVRDPSPDSDDDDASPPAPRRSFVNNKVAPQ